MHRVRLVLEVAVALVDEEGRVQSCLQQQREILGTGVSAETTAELAAFNSSEGHARSALELKQMERSTAKNPFFQDLDHDAKERLFNGCVHTPTLCE